MRRLYSLLLYLATPVVLLYLLLRGTRDRDWLARWGERFGFFQAAGHGGGIVVHAVSVGEVNAAAGLLRELARRYPQYPLCVTTFTPTGSQRVRELFGDAVFHIYQPLDLPGATKRFFRRLRPQLLVVMETEIWPNLYHAATGLGVPIMIANARISLRSVGAYRRLRALTGPTLRQVACIAAQSEADADRLAEIGAEPRQLMVSGNLKFDTPLPPGLAEEGEAIRRGWGTGRPVLVAGSTHEDDEEPLLQAFRGVLGRCSDALLVLVPRHPERFARAGQLARQTGLVVARRSDGLRCTPEHNCFLVDTMGELMRFYAACDVAFVGGSLAAIGGHNPLEPAALSKPVLFGPHTFNFEDISRQLLDCEAALRVQDSADLERAVARLFRQPETRDRMGRAGYELVRSGQGALERTLDAVGRLLTATTG